MSPELSTLVEIARRGVRRLGFAPLAAVLCSCAVSPRMVDHADPFLAPQGSGGVVVEAGGASAEDRPAMTRVGQGIRRPEYPELSAVAPDSRAERGDAAPEIARETPRKPQSGRGPIQQSSAVAAELGEEQRVVSAHAEQSDAEVSRVDVAEYVEARPRAGRTSQIQPVQYTGSVRKPPRLPAEACELCPPDPRTPVLCEEGVQPGPELVLQERFPDEYLCDGGDRDYPVHYEAASVAGLNTEDTVVEYTDSFGKRRMKPTNKVCLYAPRFAAVTTISGTNEDLAILRAGGADTTIRGANLKTRAVSVAQEQREGTERLVTRLRGSQFQSRAGVREFVLPVGTVEHDQALRTYEDVGFVATGTFTHTNEARLAKAVQSAVAWTRTQFPVMTAKVDGTGELTNRFNPSELTGTEDRKTPGRLRIAKLADASEAAPGDVITFTIRYDNLGELPLSGVVITDNLTPRLKYLADSATSDREGILDVTDNGEGSVILRWEFDAPLPGKTGGVITFKARVR